MAYNARYKISRNILFKKKKEKQNQNEFYYKQKKTDKFKLEVAIHLVKKGVKAENYNFCQIKAFPNFASLFSLSYVDYIFFSGLLQYIALIG